MRIARTCPTVLLCLAAACGGDGPTGPSLPAIAGRYAGTATLSISNQQESAERVRPMTVTLANAGADGTFSGTFVSEGGGSGVIAGVLRQDGGIDITTFGSPSGSGGGQAFMRNELPHCDLASAAFTAFSGSILGPTLRAGLTANFPCAYTDGVTTWSETTHLVLRLDGTR